MATGFRESISAKQSNFDAHGFDRPIDRLYLYLVFCAGHFDEQGDFIRRCEPAQHGIVRYPEYAKGSLEEFNEIIFTSAHEPGSGNYDADRRNQWQKIGSRQQ